MWTRSDEGKADHRVVMVLDSIFPAPSGGGAEAQVQTLGGYLTRRGVEVLVVTPMLSWGPQVACDESGGVKVFRIAYPKIKRIGAAILLLRLAVFLVRHRNQYSVIHAHIANNMAAVCCVVGRLLGRKVVVKLTGGLEMDKGILSPARTDLAARALRWALRRATYYQAISSRLCALLPQYGFDAAKVRLLPNAVDTQRFQPGQDGDELRRELGLNAPLVGVFVGRLVIEKALSFFIDSWARVFGAGGDVAFVVVGVGDLMEGLQEQVKRLGIERQIVFAGSTRDVRRYLAAADFAVLPSTSEGLSNALLEYMAAGLPVLGSRISGTEDLVIPGETGWLFGSRNSQELEACLTEVARTPKEALARMGENARQRVSDYAGLAAVGERLVSLYGLATPAAQDLSR